MKFSALLLRCLAPLLAFGIGYSMGQGSVASDISRTRPADAGRRGVDLSSKHLVGMARTNDPTGASVAATFTGKELFEKLKATPGDIETTRALQRRQRAGEFILRNEPPLMRRSQEWNFATLASKALTNNAARYNSLFSELGISPEVSRDLQVHLSRIYRASLEAQSSTIQLLDARSRYDQRMRTLLGGEKYSRYREIEKLRPAEEEVQNIQAFVVRSNCSRLDRSRELALARLIVEANLVDDGSRHGPYSPLPKPTVGLDQAITSEEDEFARLTQGTKKLVDRIGDAGLDAEQRACITAYYGQKLASKRMEIASLNDRYALPPHAVRHIPLRRDVGGKPNGTP
jgi:hypothetical protein